MSLEHALAIVGAIVPVASAGTQHTLTLQGEDLRIVKGGEWKLYDSEGGTLLLRYSTCPPAYPS